MGLQIDKTNIEPTFLKDYLYFMSPSWIFWYDPKAVSNWLEPFSAMFLNKLLVQLEHWKYLKYNITSASDIACENG